MTVQATLRNRLIAMSSAGRHPPTPRPVRHHLPARLRGTANPGIPA
jgi:hypothetical protein